MDSTGGKIDWERRKKNKCLGRILGGGNRRKALEWGCKGLPSSMGLLKCTEPAFPPGRQNKRKRERRKGQQNAKPKLLKLEKENYRKETGVTQATDVSAKPFKHGGGLKDASNPEFGG